LSQAAVFLCSYCPRQAREVETWQEKQTETRKAQKKQERARAIIGLGFLIFFLPTEIGKNQKT
jgi:hypothetical protein